MTPSAKAAGAVAVIVRFERRFQADILAGRKPFTLRSGTSRHHVDLGDRLELSPPAGAPFATAVCVFRGRVTFTRDALVRVFDPVVLGDGDKLARIFANAEQAMPDAAEYLQRIAAMDGFTSWAELFDWHVKHGQVQAGRCTREVVGWSDVKAAGEGEEGQQGEAVNLNYLYRKRPVVIEAALFDGQLVGAPGPDGKVVPRSCPEWFPAVIEEVETAGAPSVGAIVGDGDKLLIGTLEGLHTASPGDYIIRGIKGELYPCKPDIFAATYETAGAAS